MKKKHFFLIVLGLLLAFSLIGCSPKEVTLDIYAGDALQVPLTDIKNAYEAENPHVTINYYYAGSKTAETTVRTLEQGDVIILSASIIDDFSKDNLLIAGYPLATQSTGIIVKKGNPNVQSWEDLAKENIKIALINPNMGVAGMLSKKIIEQSPLAEQIQANVTRLTSDPSESIKLVENGEVDAAIIFPSAARENENITILNIPDEINQGVSIGVGVPIYTTVESEAKKFAEFIVSETGLQFFYSAGFGAIQ
jgi:ABC-type molybdate transport system substrate-binding protein